MTRLGFGLSSAARIMTKILKKVLSLDADVSFGTDAYMADIVVNCDMVSPSQVLSAGLQNLLSICDKHCASHSITFNVKKSVCMFFKSSVNKHCDYANVYLSGNHIDFVQEVKYLGVLLIHQ